MSGTVPRGRGSLQTGVGVVDGLRDPAGGRLAQTSPGEGQMGHFRECVFVISENLGIWCEAPPLLYDAFPFSPLSKPRRQTAV